MNMNEGNKGIVLNRMYTGSYLSTNLGHEVINMFTADNGNHYLYLNAKGNFATGHKGQINDMLLVRYAGDNRVEVLAWANGLKEIDGAADTYQEFNKDEKIYEKQERYINGDDNNEIKYGGANLIKLFEGSGQQNIYITYHATNFYRPIKPIYIQYVDESKLLYVDEKPKIEEEGNSLNIYLSGYQFGKATLKQYIYPTTHKNSNYKFDKRKRKNEELQTNLKKFDTKSEEEFIQEIENRVKEKRNKDWEILLQLLNPAKKKVWRKDEGNEYIITDEEINSYQPREVSLFDVVPKLQRDENCFSDALKYFMKRDKKDWKDILQKICDNSMSDIIQNQDIGAINSIEREKDATIKKKSDTEEDQNSDQTKGGRIDLFIQTEKAYIVIENKIKSDINRKGDDKIGEDQLDRYRKYVESLEKKPCFYFVLAPDYNKPDNVKGYCILTYRSLMEYLKKYHENHKEEKLWSAFYDAMKRHSYSTENESLYEDMKSTFFAIIKEIRLNQDKNG